MYDIGSRGADRGVDPANGVGSRCDTQGSAKAYELSAFLAAQHTVRLSENRLHRLPQALDRVGNTLRIKAQRFSLLLQTSESFINAIGLAGGTAGDNHVECAATFDNARELYARARVAELRGLLAWFVASCTHGGEARALLGNLMINIERRHHHPSQ